MPLKLFLAGLLSIIALPILAKGLEGQISSQISQNHYKQLSIESVIDGDTIEASSLHIRLWGIDAPERNEPLYKISKKAVELFIDGAELRCKQVDVDRYQRHVMHCYVDNTDLGGLMVQSGFARDYKKYSGGFYDKEQSYAKDAELGIWK